MPYQIDLGDHGWKHPAIKHMLYGSRENAIGAAVNAGLDPEKVEEINTRPQIWRVAAQLEDEDRVWDEGGIHVFPTINRSARWPEGRIKVFVVTGGSEGLYIHVEVETSVPYSEPKTELLLIGKTCSCDEAKWYECWISAARIAKMLGA